MKGVLMSMCLLLVAGIAPCHAQSVASAKSPVMSIQEACRNAADSHSAIDYEYCVASLASDHRSHEASDLHTLAVLATKVAIEHAASTEAKMDDLNDIEDSPHARARLSHCLELYAAAADVLRDALDNLHAHIYGKATEQLAAALGASESCEDVWKGEERVPVASHDKEYGRMAMIALGLTSGII